MIFILPIHEHDIFPHLFVPSLIYFISVSLTLCTFCFQLQWFLLSLLFLLLSFLFCPWKCDITLSQYLKGQGPFDLWLGNWKVWKTKKYRNWGGQSSLGKKLSPSEQFIPSINISLWKGNCFWVMCFGPEPMFYFLRSQRAQYENWGLPWWSSG